MKRSESTLLHTKSNTNEGWAVQIYGSNRRLLCVLDPSHGWVFLFGCVFGLLVSVIWVNVARHSPPIEPMPPSASPKLQVD
jgi:hypothetical protein